MKIEIVSIKNGWVVKHNVYLWEDEVYFKTINQAVAYIKRILGKYRSLQNG